MTNRFHNRVLLGVGALLGLCAAGCQNGWVAMHPNGALNAVASRRGYRPCIERQADCVIASSAPVASMPVVSGAPLRSAVTMQSPIIRASAEEMAGGVPVQVSSYRALPRAADTEGPALLGPGLEVRPQHLGAGLSLQEPRMQPLDMEKLPPPRRADGPMHGQIVSDPHTVMVEGHPGMMMHPHSGIIHSHAVPHEGHKTALPPYVIEPPDIISVQLLRDPKRVPQPIDGQFLVRPDGSITIGVYGTVHVAGLTLDDAKSAIAEKLSKKLKPYTVTDPDDKKVTIDVADEIVVDMVEFASKYCYLIADGGGNGASVARIPINGSDTVLDALGKIGGLPPQAAKKKIWLARPSTHQLLPIDWRAISQGVQVASNYQMFPNDRIFIQSDARIRALSEVSKTIDPFERIAGGVLLGASTKNAINARSGSSGNNNNGLNR